MSGLSGLGIILLLVALIGWVVYRNDPAKPSWVGIVAIIGAILLLIGLFI